MNTDASTLVLGYSYPDLDAYGCALAYAELLSRSMANVRAGKHCQPLAEVEFVNSFLQDAVLPTYDPGDFEQIVVVDTNRPTNLDNRVEADRVVALIDHRPGGNPDDFPNALWQIELVGAAATLIAEKFMAQNVQPSQLAAAYLLAAITSNTLNFIGAITTSRDRDAAEWLRRYAGLPDDFAHLLFTAKSNLEGERLTEQLIGDFAMMDPVGGKRVGIGQIEMVGADKLLEHREAELLAVLRTLVKDRGLDHSFTTLVDVDAGVTYFVTEEIASKSLLHQALDLRFDSNVAVLDRLILRKEFFMDLKSTLSK